MCEVCQVYIAVPPATDKARIFLDYLCASIEKRGSYTGSGRRKTGRWEETITAHVTKDVSKPLDLRWRVSWNSDGSVEPVQVSATRGAPRGWKSLALQIVNEALTSAVSGEKTKEFVRSSFVYVGSQLDGEYNLPGFRLAPLSPWTMLHSESVVTIDLYGEGVDRSHAMLVAHARAERIADLLSVFVGVGLYRFPSSKKWVLSPDGDSSELRQLGYRAPRPAPTSMPTKGSECPQGRFRAVDRSQLGQVPDMDNRRRLPSDIRRLFRIVDVLPDDESERFRASAALYRISRVAGRDLPTLAMAYQIAAVDSLAGAFGGNTNSFAQFVGRWCPEVRAAEMKKVYGTIRSAHLHGGRFPGGELELPPVRMFSGPGHVDQMVQRITVSQVMSSVLIRWLLARGSDLGVR